MKNRDMFYQNVNQGYSAPGMVIPPNGYNLNTAYQAYGPNVMPNQEYPNIIQSQDEYESRISKLERQVKNLDTRLQKLETSNIQEDNFYMI